MPLLLASGKDAAAARQLQRRARAGEIRRIYQGLYTDDRSSTLETIVRRELLSIIAALAPDAIISHRSAIESGVSQAGDVHLTGPYRRDIELPGVTLRMRKGPGARPEDIHIPTPAGPAHRSSEARALLENLQVARARDPARRHTLGQAAVEQRLERLLARDGEAALNRVRDLARESSEVLGMSAEFRKLDAVIGALLRTRGARLTHPSAVARAAGAPYDEARVDLFQKLAAYLDASPPVIPQAQSGTDRSLQAFVESYFSNYIEGTEFELAEAYSIVTANKPLKYREDDSHDVIGTFNAILESAARPAMPADFEAFALQLTAWNRQVLFSRSSKRPGEWKDEPNRAGDTLFVQPELVRGTLEKGFETIAAASTPEARGALAMFVVSEVHPFRDGNGRTARLAMNLALSGGNRTRIIIPTVFREDYLLALKALSRNTEPEPYVRMLTRAAAFSRWLDYSSRTVLFRQLEESHALSRASEAKLRFG
jgi:hypothetical protein